MSSIPTRRTTRTTRTTTAALNENAVTRPSRLAATRSKPASNAGPSTSTTSVAAVPATRATAPTAASRAKTETAAGKRKREALGEVAVGANKSKTIGTKTKQLPTSSQSGQPASKETFDGVVLKSKTAPALRQPLRVVAGPAVKRTTRSASVKEEIKEEVKSEAKEETLDDDDMMVDEHTVPTVARRVSSRRSAVAAREAHEAAPLPSRTRKTSVRTAPKQLPKQEEPEDDVEPEDDQRVKKRLRTSSEAPLDILDDLEIREEPLFETVPADEVWSEHGDPRFDEEVEADPDGDDWDDLDADDHDDPLMVSEYVCEIFDYMKEIELQTMANPNYMESQDELAWKMRGILTDWLVQVQVRFRLLPETLYLCVNIIDRFLSARVVSLAKLQLVGVTCMFIAAKYEEIMAPSVSNFLYCADSTYTEEQILQAERYILKTLDWNLSFPNPVHYLRRVSKADEYDLQVRTTAKYLLEIQCMEWRLISATPSMLAAAAIWLARMVLGRENWTPNLAHYSSYAESTIVPTANIMLNYVLKPVVHESFHKKYANKKYFKASLFVQEWALNRWEEGTTVDLAAELPMLKSQIRAERNAAPVQHDY